MSERSPQEGTECIRCDEPVAADYPDQDGDYVLLTYLQEEGAVPVCKDCFEEVKRRNVWN